MLSKESKPEGDCDLHLICELVGNNLIARSTEFPIALDGFIVASFG